jgi:hypothetical protein
VCNDGFNYRLDGPIDLHCRIGGLFESIDRLFDITALLLSFGPSAFHFFLQFCCVGAAQIFTLVLSPFFAFSPWKRSNPGIVKLVESPYKTPIESALANGILSYV